MWRPHSLKYFLIEILLLILALWSWFGEEIKGIGCCIDYIIVLSSRETEKLILQVFVHWVGAIMKYLTICIQGLQSPNSLVFRPVLGFNRNYGQTPAPSSHLFSC